MRSLLCVWLGWERDIVGSFWLFQAIPQRFDFDRFLASGAQECDWLAKQHAKDMRIGDGVLLWRGKGNNPKGAGAVGWARIVGLPAERPDASPGASYWIDNFEAQRPDCRVRLQLVETRAQKPLHYNILRHDPLLADMRVFKLRQASNFPLRPGEVERLMALWNR